MDLRSLRTMNLAATILFGLFGSLIPIYYIFMFGMMFWYYPYGGNGFFTICAVIGIIWIAVILTITILLYRKTVIGLDRGEFDGVKRWLIIGIVLGFLFSGIIPFILFLISFVLFDGAVRQTYYPYPTWYGYPPPPQYPPYPYPPYPHPPYPHPPPPGYPPPEHGMHKDKLKRNRRDE